MTALPLRVRHLFTLKPIPLRRKTICVGSLRWLRPLSRDFALGIPTWDCKLAWTMREGCGSAEPGVCSLVWGTYKAPPPPPPGRPFSPPGPPGVGLRPSPRGRTNSLGDMGTGQLYGFVIIAVLAQGWEITLTMELPHTFFPRLFHTCLLLYCPSPEFLRVHTVFVLSISMPGFHHISNFLE